MRTVIDRFRGKALRYLAVSALGTVITQVILLVLVGWFDWDGPLANVVAVCTSAVPAFFANRAWVWRKVGNHSLSREVVPFWVMAMLGLGLSTLFAWIAQQLTQAALAINAANLLGFGLLWVVKFLVLDTYLFSDDDAEQSSLTPSTAPR
jgi:putative flippase GtrA